MSRNNVNSNIRVYLTVIIVIYEMKETREFEFFDGLSAIFIVYWERHHYAGQKCQCFSVRCSIFYQAGH